MLATNEPVAREPRWCEDGPVGLRRKSYDDGLANTWRHQPD